MTREFRKSIMSRSKLKNEHLKWSSKEKFLGFKYAKQKCASLTKRAKREYYKKASEGNTVNSKIFGKSILPFLTNRNVRNNYFITLQER